MKLAVIGGGGVRSMFLAKSIAQKASELCVKIIADETAISSADSKRLSEYRRICENALMYSLINNYAVSDIADEVNRLRQEDSSVLSEIKQQKLAFDAITKACDYFVKLRPE